jgi:hypothetical protein
MTGPARLWLGLAFAFIGACFLAIGMFWLFVVPEVAHG